MRLAKRLAIAVAGGLVILLGVLLIPTPVPGPGTVLIPAGLAILALEFDWAQRWLDRLRRRLRSVGPAETNRRAEPNVPLAK